VFGDPASAGPLLAVPVFVGPVSAVPFGVVPAGVVPAGVVPAGVVSDGVVSAGLVLVPPETGGLDVGCAGVEELLPGGGEDPVAPGLAEPGGLVAGVEHCVSVGWADVLPPFALSLGFAEAAEVAVLVAVEVALAVAVAVPVAVSVAVPVTVALPAGLLLALPLGGLLTEFSGDGLGAADLVGVAVAEADGELVGHPVAGASLWTAEVPP